VYISSNLHIAMNVARSTSDYSIPYHVLETHRRNVREVLEFWEDGSGGQKETTRVRLSDPISDIMA
jgi:hypothetical protein